MEFFKRLFSRVGKAYGNEPVWVNLSNGVGAHLPTLPPDASLIREYHLNGSVRACVDVNARSIAEAATSGIHLYSLRKATTKSLKLDGKTKAKLRKKSIRYKGTANTNELTELVDHPILSLLYSVNAYLNGYDLFSLYAKHLDVLGRAYWLLPDDGEPTEIMPLMPQCVTLKRDKSGNVIAYYYRIGLSEPQELSADRVIAFRDESLNDIYGGAASKLASVYPQITLSSKLNGWQNNLIDNRARIEGVFIFEDSTGTVEQERFERKVDLKFSGKGNGKYAYLDGKTRFVPTSYAPTDLAPIQLAQEAERVLCNAMGCPEALLKTQSTIKSNLEAAIGLHVQNVTKPRLRQLEDVLNQRLLPLYGDDSLFIVFDDPSPEDEEMELRERDQTTKENQLLVNARAVTVNELRGRMGLEPLSEGGEELAGNIPAAPIAPIALDTEPEVVKSVEPLIPHVDGLLRINDAVASGTLPRAVAINQVSKLWGLSQSDAKELVGYPVNVTPKACSCGVDHKSKSPGEHKQLAGIIKKYLAKLADHYSEQASKGLDHPTSKLMELHKANGRLPTKFIPMDQWTDDLAHEVKPVVELMAKRTAEGKQRVYLRAGASPARFSVVPARIDEAVDRLSLKFAHSTLETINGSLNDALENIREGLREGIRDEGESVRELTKRVGEIVNDPERAELIARTETSRAIHIGQQIAAKASGIVKGFRFVVSSDACPDCLDLEGKEIPVDGSFALDGYSDAPLPVHVQCRCTMNEILSEEGSD
jgi:HK97 family phage portal protein